MRSGVNNKKPREACGIHTPQTCLANESEMRVYGKSRPPPVEPCAVHSWDVYGGLLPCAHFPPQSTRFSEIILITVSKALAWIVFQSCLNKVAEFLEIQNKGKVLPPCLRTCFTMLWPARQTGDSSLSLSCSCSCINTVWPVLLTYFDQVFNN